MVFLSKFIYFCTFIVFIKPVHSQQSYDRFNCSTESEGPGSNYLCTTQRCDAYIVYRAQKNFQTLYSIAPLFNLTSQNLLVINNMTEADSSNIIVGQEIIIPISCSCPDRFSQAIVMYNLSSSDSFAAVACGVFEGLVKTQSLVEENPGSEGDNPDALMIKVPIRCACPNENDTSNGVKFLVTYPVIKNDNIDIIARKFGLPEIKVLEANRIESSPTIFPQTIVLIPLNHTPVVNWDIENPALSPRGVIPLAKVTSGETTSKPLVFLVPGVVLAVVCMIVACCVFVCIQRKNHPRRFQPLSARSPLSPNLSPSLSPKLSPDFLDGMSKLKHSLINYSLEELRIATENFNEASVIGTAMYRGSIGGSYVAIEQINSEHAARHIIDILTKINHLNVQRLKGCCHRKRPYLVFEFAENGSLRDCLSNDTMSRQLTWEKRMQIAFDLAVAIHYIHYCTKPAYVHRNINSRNVLITVDWRAKISGFRLAKPVVCKEENEKISWNESVVVGTKGYLAPEYLTGGLATLKVDVFAYGIVLLELLSGREVTMEGKLLKNSVDFLLDCGLEGSSGCLDKLNKFWDPALQGDDCPIGDAICLTLLAKACTEEDPHQRPTMNDVLRAISRMA
ncbi:hypothetical protein Ddye_002206 [Dipteronia dyeriana]|uniref:Uncharacterized protein n=1 Tax=Dipteronia dyeriana TaxID=168575 RepID=A0AAD9XR17_9ROSI|nr:hypothetical protein Ddye_002206 [Dipteronia dyeriana]